MISSFRNFAKTKFAGLLVFIMIIPFVFWGMGSMFSSGNTNNIAKINKTNISTQEFIDYLNSSNIPEQTIRANLNNNIIEELLSSLVSSKLLELEIKDFNLIISENTLLKKIKENKNFLDDNGQFQRTKYEKFLLENNQSAPQFEQRLKKRELQKNLFDYIGAGTVSPQFLINKLFEEENKKLKIDFISLNTFYKKEEEFQNEDLVNFIQNNKETLKVEYLDFNYAIINPKNLTGVDEFSQSFFDKIDEIEIDISNDVEFETIVSKYNIESNEVNNFKFSENKTPIEKKIFELRENNFDIFENNNNYILYKIKNTYQKEPDLADEELKDEITKLLVQKNKFEFNRELLDEINNKKFNENDFIEMGKNNIQTIKLNSIRDNKKFEINSVEVLYSLPINSFTLINDEKNNIYLAQVKGIENEILKNGDQLNEYIAKQNTKIKSDMLRSYDIYLNKKYKVDINQKTIERVRNYFQ